MANTKDTRKSNCREVVTIPENYTQIHRPLLRMLHKERIQASSIRIA